MSFKIIIVESKIDENRRDDTEYLEDSDLDMSIVGSFDSFIDVIENAPSNIIDSFFNDLKSKGWVNVQDIKNREDKIKALKQFFIISTDRYGQVESIDINDINKFSQYKLERLAMGSCHIVQKVSNECLPDEAKKIYDKAIKKYTEKKKKNAKNEKDKKEKAKQRKIDKAKKLLEDEGIKL